MCIYPDYSFTENICDYCMAENTGQKWNYPALAEEELTEDDWWGGHFMCGDDDMAFTMEACACRNMNHNVQDPVKMWEQRMKAAGIKVA